MTPRSVESSDKPMPGTPVTVNPYNARDIVTLPLYGRIAAGTPIEALRDMRTQIDVPIGLLGNGEPYALDMAGHSMADARTTHGTTVIIHHSANTANGTHVGHLVEQPD